MSGRKRTNIINSDLLVPMCGEGNIEIEKHVSKWVHGLKNGKIHVYDA